MNEDISSEDRTILAALEALERGSGEPLAASGEGEAETLARLYTEVLGLVPYELEPAAPRPEARARLLAAVRGEEADETRPGDATQEVEPRPAPQRPAPVPRPATSREMPAAPRVAPRAGMVPRRRSRWPMALAAALILALAGLSGWLYLRQVRMEETIAHLEGEVAGARLEGERAVAGMRTEMERMRERFTLVTTPAVTASPLRPADEQMPARGILYVAADHQHWYLAVHDLPPAEPGRDYQLWWVTDAGNVPAMTFEARTGEKVELASEEMPAGTRDVMITLEPEGGTREGTPAGPEILRAAGVYQL